MSAHIFSYRNLGVGGFHWHIMYGEPEMWLHYKAHNSPPQRRTIQTQMSHWEAWWSHTYCWKGLCFSSAFTHQSTLLFLATFLREIRFFPNTQTHSHNLAQSMCLMTVSLSYTYTFLGLSHSHPFLSIFTRPTPSLPSGSCPDPSPGPITGY